jgi:hypothetical protein
MSKKSKFPELKAELRQREAESREIRKLIHGSSGMDRWQHWDDKRSYGRDTRCLLLCYAMLRGIPHHVVEPKYDRNVLYWINRGMKAMADQRGLALSSEAIEQWLNAAAPVVAQVTEAAE